MKKFIIMGNGNAITYKDFFPYIKNNEIWLGYTLFVGKMPYFQVPLDTDISKGNYYYENGKLFKQVNSICWFTNLDHAKRNKPLDLYKHYSNEYKHYDNYCAIEVGKVKDIPVDDYVDIEIPDEEYNKWKQCYGDDIEIIEK